VSLVHISLGLRLSELSIALGGRGFLLRLHLLLGSLLVSLALLIDRLLVRLVLGLASASD